MDDEAILAGIDDEPDAFAAFYRRHVDELLEQFAQRTRDPALAADLCAETFAAALDAAHRFDPERGPAADWLREIARRLLEEARRRGAVEDRARRRLGLAALAPGERFVGELEEELVAAARFRASRRHERPRAPLALLGVALAALAAVAVVVAGGGGDRAQPDGTRRASLVAPPAPMLPIAGCGGMDVRGESAAARAWRAGYRTGLVVVPALGASGRASCAPVDGGACLVAAGASSYRCFRRADIRAGRALARTPQGLIAGIAPAAVGRVTLTAGDRSASASVVDNVYATRLGVPPGTPVRVGFERPWLEICRRTVPPELLERVAVLRRAPDERFELPQPVRRALDLGADYRFDGVVVSGARRWGGDGGVDFWAVPVVARGSERCAPANGVCIAAVPRHPPADAECMLRRRRDADFWRVAPLLPGKAAIYGVVPDGVTGARVTAGTRTAWVGARANVIAGVLPFPYADGVRVELVGRPAAH